jgi:hypothetical protein
MVMEKSYAAVIACVVLSSLAGCGSCSEKKTQPEADQPTEVPSAVLKLRGFGDGGRRHRFRGPRVPPLLNQDAGEPDPTQPSP